MKANEAKKIIKDYLEKNGIPYSRLSSKTFDFTDLDRALSEWRVVTVHGVSMKPGPLLGNLKSVAKDNGFGIKIEYTREAIDKMTRSEDEEDQ